jgi:hypothetical protein
MPVATLRAYQVVPNPLRKADATRGAVKGLAWRKLVQTFDSPCRTALGLPGGSHSAQ